MKLRNKIDGTITEGDVWIKTKVHREPWQCKSLEELNEHWEDYKEPLIKEEKIRKAVKVWAEANHVKCARIVGVGTLRCERTGVDIEFDGAPFVGWVTELKTIAELCGEDDDEA